MLRLLVIFIICYSALYSSDRSCRVHDILKVIPKEDQKEIADFFRGMLSHDDIASVLLGGKSSGVNSITHWLIRAPNKIWEPKFLEYRGWNIWKKYSDKLPLKVAFIEEYNGQGVDMWVVKKQHQADLTHFLKMKLSGTEKRKQMGLLLGYPSADVEGFIKMESIETTLSFFPYEVDNSGLWMGIDNEDLMQDSSGELVRLIKDLEMSFNIVDSWEKEGPFFCSLPYKYRAFSKPNVPHIESFKQQLADLYNSDNFLEEVLQLLIVE